MQSCDGTMGCLGKLGLEIPSWGMRWVLQPEELRGEQQCWGNSSKGQIFSPLHPASRGQKLFSAPNNPCFEGTFLLDLNSLAGLCASLIAKAVFGALQGAECQAPSWWRDPWAEASMQIPQDLFAVVASWVCAGTQLLFCCALTLCHHLMAHEMRHTPDGRMCIGFCLARLSPSPDLLVLLQGDRLT